MNREREIFELELDEAGIPRCDIYGAALTFNQRVEFLLHDYVQARGDRDRARSDCDAVVAERTRLYATAEEQGEADIGNGLVIVRKVDLMELRRNRNAESNVSYSVYLKDPDYGSIIESVGSYTQNVHPMYVKAFGHCLSDLNGFSCQKAILILMRAIIMMRDQVRVEEFVALNPTNGCGDYDGAVAYLEKIVNACHRHPDAILDIYVE